MSKSKMHPPADLEIAQLQQRIYLHRLGLRLSIETAQQAFRERLSSPGALLAAGAAGFMLERFTRPHAPRSASSPGPRSAATSRRASVIAEAVRTALRFLQSGPGLWLAARIASGAAERAPQDPSSNHPYPQ
jgi:hypothetical protein